MAVIRMNGNVHKYGEGANSYHAAGEIDGITCLVDEFYQNMDTFPQAKIIREMHPSDLSESRKKLMYFLCGWLGGPNIYSEYYGAINIPSAHGHLAIGDAERDAWLCCMKVAIDKQHYQESFKDYLFEQLKIPAERVTQRCAYKI